MTGRLDIRLATLSMVFGATLAGCAVETPQAEPQTSATESAISYAKTTELWDTSANDINTIWPETLQNGTPITNMYVLVKGGNADGQGNPQVFAFVVWNGTNVGHVYRTKKGFGLNNLNAIRDQAIATRTNGMPSVDGGGTGSPDVDPIPHPHPNGDCCEFTISANEVENAKLNAVAIRNATVNFFEYGKQ